MMTVARGSEFLWTVGRVLLSQEWYSSVELVWAL